MATFTVTTLADETFGGGTASTEVADGTGLSLREAIGLANSSSDADRIEFDPSLFTSCAPLDIIAAGDPVGSVWAQFIPTNG
jgi:hypothetical protein